MELLSVLKQSKCEYCIIIRRSERVMHTGQLNIPPQHLDATLHLVQLFDMEIDQAYRILKLENFNVENAIARKFTTPQKFTRNSRNNSPIDLENSIQHIQYIHVDSPQHYQRPDRNKSRQDKANQKKKYEKTYLIKKAKQVKGRSTRNKKRDINEENDNKQKIEDFDFESALSMLIEGKVNVNFQVDVFETFHKLWEERKLIAIHCLRFAQTGQSMPLFEQVSRYAKQVYRIPKFVEVFNKYFINFGIDPTKFDFSYFSFLKDLITQGDLFSIILLRYDEPEQKVTVFKKLPFSTTFKLSAPVEFQVQVKKIILEESLLKNREMSGGKKMSEGERKRLQEDRIIRQEQQQQYYKQLQQQIPEENQPNIQNVVVQQPKLDIFQQRKLMKQSLNIYPENIEDGIIFKIRLPNCENLLLSLPRSQKIDYIFKYIESHEKESLGFIDEAIRKFDIILPLQRVSLSEKRAETLDTIFGDSDMETLVVKQQ